MRAPTVHGVHGGLRRLQVAPGLADLVLAMPLEKRGRGYWPPLVVREIAWEVRRGGRTWLTPPQVEQLGAVAEALGWTAPLFVDEEVGA